MSERMRPALALAFAVALSVPKPSLAETQARVQVRLTGADFANPVLADYVGGLASFTDVQDDVGQTRIPVPGRLHLTNVTLRRTQVDDALVQWRKKVTDGGVDYRRDVVLEFLTLAGTTLARFHLGATWPSSYSIAGSLAPSIPGATPKTVSVEVVTLVFDDYSREQ